MFLCKMPNTNIELKQTIRFKVQRHFKWCVNDASTNDDQIIMGSRLYVFRIRNFCLHLRVTGAISHHTAKKTPNVPVQVCICHRIQQYADFEHIYYLYRTPNVLYIYEQTDTHARRGRFQSNHFRVTGKVLTPATTRCGNMVVALHVASSSAPSLVNDVVVVVVVEIINNYLHGSENSLVPLYSLVPPDERNEAEQPRILGTL